jgi:hypothetical protein
MVTGTNGHKRSEKPAIIIVGRNVIGSTINLLRQPPASHLQAAFFVTAHALAISSEHKPLHLNDYALY